MSQHIEAAHQQLGELAAMQAQTERVEREILARAEKRLGEVDGQIARLRRSGRLHEEEPAREYQAAILERGKLHQVIAQARAHLAA